MISQGLFIPPLTLLEWREVRGTGKNCDSPVSQREEMLHRHIPPLFVVDDNRIHPFPGQLPVYTDDRHTRLYQLPHNLAMLMNGGQYDTGHRFGPYDTPLAFLFATIFLCIT